MQNRTIFIRNIDSSVTFSELSELFNYFGYVKDITIIKKKGIGFVKMSDPMDAYRAILGLNNLELRGQKLRVEKALSDNERLQTKRKSNRNKI